MWSLHASRLRRAAVAVLGVAGACAVLIGCAGDDAPTTAPERTRSPIDGSGAFPSLKLPTDATSTKASLPGLATADVNQDGFRDVLVTDRAGHRVRVHLGTGPSSFQEGAALLVNDPVRLTDADVNGDGLPDAAVYSPTGRRVSIFAGNGAGGFTPVAAATSPEAGLAIVAIDLDGNGQQEIFLTTANANRVVRVADAAGGYAVTTIDAPVSTLPPDTALGLRDGLDARAAYANDCGDEPDCEPNSQGEGIQECMRAAECRADKCGWAACVLYGGSWWLAPRYAGALAACAAVLAIELVACLPTEIIGSVAGAAARPAGDATLSTKSSVVVARTFEGVGGGAEFRYFVAGGRVQLELTLTDGAGETTSEVHDVDAYAAPLTVKDDGVNVVLTDRNGVVFGLDAAGQKQVASSIVATHFASNLAAGRDPIVIPLGRCVLVVGYSPEEYPGCLVAVLACDRDGDFKPDYCRMLVKCPGQPVRISDCTSQVQD